MLKSTLRILLGLSVVALSPVAGHAQSQTELAISGDPVAGENVFKKCKTCHTMEQDGANRVGPNLYGIVGGNVANNATYRYSNALTAFSGDWTIDRLSMFLAKPRAAVPGTKMTFAGLNDPEDIADVIAYLNEFSDTPLMPMGAEEATETHAEADLEEPEFGVLFEAEGVETTFYSCTACHSERIVAQQGLSRERWEKMLKWMVDEQGMSELEEPDLSEVLDYLSTHYGVDRPNFPTN